MTINQDDIRATIRDFIRSRFGVPADDPDFDDDINVFDYGYVDSFGAATLTSFVENQYSIKITPSDLVAFPLNSVREIASFVQKRMNKEI